MSFIEFETWKIKPGYENEHDDMIRKWFNFVVTHQKELFPEWKSIRYFRQVDRDGSRHLHHAYKARRKDWSGPYAAYKELDPYQFFDLDTVTTDYWEPQDDIRADFPPPSHSST